MTWTDWKRRIPVIITAPQPRRTLSGRNHEHENHTWAALALATGLALTGCTTSGGPEAGTDVDTASSPAAEAVAKTTEDQSTEAAPEESAEDATGGTQAEGIFTGKIDRFFQGKVPPGKKQSTRVAFGSPAGKSTTGR